MATEAAPRDTPNPRRILAVSLADSAETLSRFVQDLSGTAPAPAPGSLAGTTHVLPLRTRYYAAAVPVWLDLVGAGAAAAAWADAFLSEAAREVRRALGAVVVVVALPGRGAARELVRQVGRLVREGMGGWAWEGVGLVVGVGGEGEGGDVLDAWEDECAEWGLEFVRVAGGGGGDVGRATTTGEGGRNEFGERVGLARVLEALQANDWSGGDDGGGGGGGDDGADGEQGDQDDEFGALLAAPGGGGGRDDGALDPRDLDFGLVGEEDVAGLKQAVWDADQAQVDADEADGEPGHEKGGEDEVQKLERMVHKLQAVRDLTAGMPDEQRRRAAKRAVGEVMRDW